MDFGIFTEQIRRGGGPGGWGRGGGRGPSGALGVRKKEGGAGFWGALETTRGGGRGEPSGKGGIFYRSHDAPGPPRPAQHPPPPVRMAATTAETFPRVARM